MVFQNRSKDLIYQNLLLDTRTIGKSDNTLLDYYFC
nr:hypothetical protein [Tanacetum cinerariifolium]